MCSRFNIIATLRNSSFIFCCCFEHFSCSVLLLNFFRFRFLLFVLFHQSEIKYGFFMWMLDLTSLKPSVFIPRNIEIMKKYQLNLEFLVPNYNNHDERQHTKRKNTWFANHELVRYTIFGKSIWNQPIQVIQYNILIKRNNSDA